MPAAANGPPLRLRGPGPEAPGGPSAPLAGLRVLAAHPSLDLYGADLMLVRSLGAMRRAGATVLLLVPEEGPLLSRLDAEGLPHRVVEATVLRKALLRPAGLAWTAVSGPAEVHRLRRLLRVSRPDLVYVNTMTLPTWLLAARLEGIRSMCHVRELEETLPTPVARGLTLPLLAASHLIVNSEATGRFVAGHWPALRSRTSVVYNGLDFPPSEVPVADDAAAGRDRRRRVVLVGRLSPRKGQDVAVRAIGSLARRGVDVELDLVGDTFRGYEWFERELRRLADEAGVGERVHLRGYQAPVWEWYRSADVVVVPSRLEPFGNVAAEALAVGSPVVVSGVGGLTEIVEDGRSGLVVPPADPGALADALERLVREPGLARELARRGQRDVRDRFSVEGYEQRLLAALVRVLQGGQTGSSSVE